LCWCILGLFVLFFFFSSRRRHTRSKRDWSSDVCSSDLSSNMYPPLVLSIVMFFLIMQKVFMLNLLVLQLLETKRKLFGCQRPWRSEERRVGKECRSRWGGCE